MDPLIAGAARAAREDGRQQVRLFWQQADSDGLLAADVDPNWLAETAAILAAADTYLHIRPDAALVAGCVRALAVDQLAAPARFRGHASCDHGC